MDCHKFAMALLVLSGLAVAAPVAGDASFTIHQEDSGGRIVRDGPRALEAVYLKYGIAVPAHLSEAIAKSQSGAVAAKPQQYDSDYLCPIQIGIPAQTVKLDFDTGSSDLWVFSSELPKNMSEGHKIYTPKSSSTSKLLKGEHWMALYADFAFAEGNIYTDKVSVGKVTATSQAVECATSVAERFVKNTKRDGLLGLAFKQLNQAKPSKVKPFVFNVLKTLAQPAFTANLKHHQPGSYDFGFIDKKKFKGSLTYVPRLTSSGFWRIVINSPQNSTRAIVDTGTALLVLPRPFAEAYWAKVEGAADDKSLGGYVFPCHAALPDYSITIGGSNFSVPGEYLNYAPLSVIDPRANSTKCYGGLQTIPDFPSGVLGDIFLKNQYVVFDVGQNRVGFAQQA